jgi:hypothetical protein
VPPTRRLNTSTVSAPMATRRSSSTASPCVAVTAWCRSVQRGDHGRDGLIWRVNEYASLVHEQATQSLRPTVSRLGLSPRSCRIWPGPAAILPTQAALPGPGAGPAAGGQRVRLQPQPDFLPAQPGAGAELLPLRQPGAPAAPAGQPWTPPCRRSIDELAFAAGFNSLSAFYSASASTRASRPRPTSNKFLCVHARKTAPDTTL